MKALSWFPCAWSGFSLEREGSFWHRHGVSSWLLFWCVLPLPVVLPCSLTHMAPLLCGVFFLAKCLYPALTLVLSHESCGTGVTYFSVGFLLL